MMSLQSMSLTTNRQTPTYLLQRPKAKHSEKALGATLENSTEFPANSHPDLYLKLVCAWISIEHRLRLALNFSGTRNLGNSGRPSIAHIFRLHDLLVLLVSMTVVDSFGYIGKQ